MTSVSLGHLIHLDILVIARDILAQREIDAIKTMRKVKDRIYAVFQFKIWIEHLFADFIFGLLEFL